MYRRLLLSALFGLTLSACVPYYDGGATYYRSEVYTAPAPAYYYGGPLTRMDAVTTRRHVTTSRRHVITSQRRVITQGLLTGRTRTRAGEAVTGAMVVEVMDPIMEAGAAATGSRF